MPGTVKLYMAERLQEYRRNLQILDVTRERDATRRGGKADLDELFHVEGSVVVGCFRDGGGNRNARCIDSLPAIMAVDSTSDFADENRSQTLASNLLVNAEEIHLDRR